MVVLQQQHNQTSATVIAAALHCCSLYIFIYAHTTITNTYASAVLFRGPLCLPLSAGARLSSGSAIIVGCSIDCQDAEVRSPLPRANPSRSSQFSNAHLCPVPLQPTPFDPSGYQLGRARSTPLPRWLLCVLGAMDCHSKAV